MLERLRWEPYRGGLFSGVGVLLHRREVGEELWQLFGDFPPDRPGSVLELWRRHPAGDDVVSVHLQQKTGGGREDGWV